RVPRRERRAAYLADRCRRAHVPGMEERPLSLRKPDLPGVKGEKRVRHPFGCLTLAPERIVVLTLWAAPADLLLEKRQSRRIHAKRLFLAACVLAGYGIVL